MIRRPAQLASEAADLAVFAAEIVAANVLPRRLRRWVADRLDGRHGTDTGQ